MQYLVDTGVLLRLFDRSDPNHAAIRDVLRTLKAKGYDLAVTPQNIAEFWNVSTRPSSARGGYGQTPDVTDRRVAFIERYSTILHDSPAAYHEWRKLVVAQKVKGVSVHDARLAAAMMAHGVPAVITLNAADFSRYSAIQALSPEEVLDALRAN